MKYTYDLHVHSALSPCSEEEMTPNNIVNMALVNGLDLLAVTDHNTAGNLAAISLCAEGKPIIFIPGIEVETAEEVHVICLFGEVQDALSMGEILKSRRRTMKNRPEIFGRQLFLDHRDRLVGEEEQLLIFATDIPLEEVFHSVDERGGCAIFAHLDRIANSVCSLLGALPKDLETGVVEISNTAKGQKFLDRHQELKNKLVLYNSDGHSLKEMNRGEHTLDIPIPRQEMTTKKFVEWLRVKGKG